MNHKMNDTSSLAKELEILSEELRALSDTDFVARLESAATGEFSAPFEGVSWSEYRRSGRPAWDASSLCLVCSGELRPAESTDESASQDRQFYVSEGEEFMCAA